MRDATAVTPDWFWNAIDTKPESDSIDVQGADVNYLYWSKPGNPGLLFVHGHNAHAHWWDFIAPFFKDEYQSVALDMSGMGDSDHREEYSADLYAEEIVAVADKCGMGSDTVLVSHSYGGIMSIRAVAQFPDRFRGLVLLDSGVKHPEEVSPPEPTRLARTKLYPSSEIARSRFRLQPPQQCKNQYIVDYIARTSVEYIEDGFGWKFDEEQRSRMMPYEDLESDFGAISTRCALIYGGDSELFSSKSADYMKSVLSSLEVTEIIDAQHHLFLDQPLKFIECLTKKLEAWQ